MKKQFIIFVTVLMLIFLLANVKASSIITIDLDDKGSAVFIGKTNDNPILPEGIKSENGSIYGITSNLTSKQGDLWLFTFRLKNSQITTVLPQNSVIENLDHGEISLSTNHISISSSDAIEVSYRLTQAPSTSYFLNYLLVALLIVILVFLYFYIRLKKKKVSEKNKLELIKKVLNERENMILDNLKKSGKIKMSHLRKLTQIPKASFSRHILELEKKKLINKSGEGKNKFIQMTN